MQHGYIYWKIKRCTLCTGSMHGGQQQHEDVVKVERFSSKLLFLRQLRAVVSFCADGVAHMFWRALTS